MQELIELYRRSSGPVIENSQACSEWVSEVNEAYARLHRPLHDARDIVDLKLGLCFWRSSLLDRLLTRPPDWMAAQPETAQRVLRALNVPLLTRQRQLASGLLGEPLLAELMAMQGVATPGYPQWDRAAGPGVELDIVANRGSSWPYEKWRKNERFGRYDFDDEGVRYRGISFRPGDVLLANVNVDGNGVYTALSEPKGFSSHSGFFAILEHDGRRIPVVVETYEKGVRPVPLSIFLGASFCSYVEVYRHTDYTPGHAADLNRSAVEIIQRVRAYNFDSEDLDPHYLSCTAVGRVMHAAAGLRPAKRVSELGHPMVRSNLSKVGYTFFDYFGPVDFLLNDCFRCIGFVDNNQLDRLLARELVDREFRKRFCEIELQPHRFPFPYALNLWGIGQMRKRSLLGKLISLIEGFDADTLPRGPDPLMAVILLAEKQIGKSIRRTRTAIAAALAGLDYLDVTEFSSDERVQAALEQHLLLPWLQTQQSAALAT